MHGQLAAQIFGDFVVSFALGYLQCVGTVDVHLQAAALELVKDVEMTLFGHGHDEKVSARAGVSAVVGEELHDLQMAVLGGQTDRVLVDGRDIRAVVEKDLYDFQMAAHRRQPDGHVVLSVDVRAAGQQFVHDLGVAFLRGDAERFRVAAVGIRAVIQKKADGFEIAVSGRADESCPEFVFHGKSPTNSTPS